MMHAPKSMLLEPTVGRLLIAWLLWAPLGTPVRLLLMPSLPVIRPALLLAPPQISLLHLMPLVSL